MGKKLQKKVEEKKEFEKTDWRDNVIEWHNPLEIHPNPFMDYESEMDPGSAAFKLGRRYGLTEEEEMERNPGKYNEDGSFSEEYKKANGIK